MNGLTGEWCGTVGNKRGWREEGGERERERKLAD